MKNDIFLIFQGDRLEDDWVPTEDTRDPEVVADEERRAEAEKRAEVLEMVGDLPSADAKPPPNMVFVCKLNPVTTEEVCLNFPGSFLFWQD